MKGAFLLPGVASAGIKASEAADRVCPYRGAAKLASLCVAARCMMWRWGEPAPPAAEAEAIDPKFDDIDARDDDAYMARISEGEPSRPDHVPADWGWVLFETDADGDWWGGHWLESATSVAARNAEAQAARRGYCAIAGKPEFVP